MNLSSFRYSNRKPRRLENDIETDTLATSISILHSPRLSNKQRDVSRVMSEASSSEIVRPSLNNSINESTLQSTKLKVRTDRSAMVLVSIVILFLLTHSYRIALKVYEVASPNAHTIEKFKICFALKRYFQFVIFQSFFLLICNMRF